MSRTRVALYEFLPYGAPELLEVQRSYLTRAVSTASTGVVLLFLLAFAVTAYVAGHPSAVPDPGGIIVEFVPPPQFPPPPTIAPTVTAPAVTPPQGAKPVPVPDHVAPTDVTIPSQDQLRQSGPADTHASETGGVPLVVENPARPDPNGYVFHDVEPEAVDMTPPLYPDIAREAQVEGTVYLRVLVDIDGRVKDVRVLRTVPLLEEAAVTAAHKWVFTPALANGHPVAVWVAVPVRFSLH